MTYQLEFIRKSGKSKKEGLMLQITVLCEEELTRHLLMALQGIEGTYIICGGHKHSELQVGNLLAVDDTLRFQLLRLLPIANAYLYLRQQSEKPYSDRLFQVCCTFFQLYLIVGVGLPVVLPPWVILMPRD